MYKRIPRIDSLSSHGLFLYQGWKSIKRKKKAGCHTEQICVIPWSGCLGLYVFCLYFPHFFLGHLWTCRRKTFFFFLIVFTPKIASLVKAPEAELKERNCFLVSFLFSAEDTFLHLGTQHKLFQFSKYTLPSVGKVMHFHSADKICLRINCSAM